MPVAGERVKIAYKTQAEFDVMQNKDENTIYFVTDTNRIFVGNSQYYGIMEYRVVDTLPQTGVRGTIYLIAHNHGSSDIYDEYLWVVDKYEKIGNTDIDLSGYYKKADIVVCTKEFYDSLETKTAMEYHIIEE